jgi:glycosyltransferase involved in cell wall biosynthesis
VGVVSPELKKIISSKNLNGVDFKGIIANHNLPYFYSTAHVFVLPSIEEGLAMVQGEALACGCPVIATHNTGAEDLFQNGSEGFIVPTRSSDFIFDRLQQLADDKVLRSEMSEAARRKVKDMGGWDTYGDGFKNLVNSMI